MIDPSANAAGLYEVVWMDDERIPRRARFFCQSSSEMDVYSAGRRMAEQSRHGSCYVITVRETQPDW